MTNEIDFEIVGMNKQEVYEHYERWCLDNRFKKTEIKTPTKFTQTVNKIGYKLKEKRIDGVKTKIWIKLTD